MEIVIAARFSLNYRRSQIDFFPSYIKMGSASYHEYGSNMPGLYLNLSGFKKKSSGWQVENQKII